MLPEEQVKEARKLLEDAKDAIKIGAITGLMMHMNAYYKAKAETEKSKDMIYTLIVLGIMAIYAAIAFHVLKDLVVWGWQWLSLIF